MVHVPTWLFNQQSPCIYEKIISFYQWWNHPKITKTMVCVTIQKAAAISYRYVCAIITKGVQQGELHEKYVNTWRTYTSGDICIMESKHMQTYCMRVCVFVDDVRSWLLVSYLGLFKPATLCACVHFHFSLSLSSSLCFIPTHVNPLCCSQQRLKPPKMMKGLRGVVRVIRLLHVLPLR